jgi:hypothetical protein
MMQTAQLTTHPILNTEKRTVCHLVVDGNAHRLELLSTSLPENKHPLFSEAMLPQIRTLAMMIAAQRHDFEQPSPAVFTEEADWFAARILVLQARAFHLEGSLKSMLETANQRAEAVYSRRNPPRPAHWPSAKPADYRIRIGCTATR